MLTWDFLSAVWKLCRDIRDARLFGLFFTGRKSKRRKSSFAYLNRHGIFRPTFFPRFLPCVHRKLMNERDG
jgi:hypothetical protein